MIKRILVFQNPSYLSLCNAQLVLKMPEIEKCENLYEPFKRDAFKTIPIEDIGIIVLDNKQITITNALLVALLENNCAVITCNDHHMPIGLQLSLESNSLQLELF